MRADGMNVSLWRDRTTSTSRYYSYYNFPAAALLGWTGLPQSLCWWVFRTDVQILTLESFREKPSQCWWSGCSNHALFLLRVSSWKTLQISTEASRQDWPWFPTQHFDLEPSLTACQGFCLHSTQWNRDWLGVSVRKHMDNQTRVEWNYSVKRTGACGLPPAWFGSSIT